MSNIITQAITTTKQQRSSLKNQTPFVVWFTGLSGAGKSTLANLLEQKLHEMGRHTYILDGDNVRLGLNKDLSFSAEDRVENIRRIAETAKLMADAGLIVLTAFISPFKQERELAKQAIGEQEFIEVFVDTPLELAESRDVKGLYAKARKGEIKDFTGIDSPYEPPTTPDIHLKMDQISVEDALQQLLTAISDKIKE
jgi:bifunctional enzyme CysN/CysC